jgi:hypothetical protein
MYIRKTFTLLAALVLCTSGSLARQAAATASARTGEEVAQAQKTAAPRENWQTLSDITTGLSLRPPFPVQADETADFVRQLVKVQWRAGDPIDLYVVRPKIAGKVPVILYMYGYPVDPAQFRDDGWAKRATAGGFAAVGFVSALTGQRYFFRPMKQWFVSELPEALGSTVHDVQLVLNYLSDRGDMDMSHVGMFGMGSGASIAILAAAADSRIKVLDLLDPWGDWPDWIRDSPLIPENERPRYLTEDFLKSVATLDPIEYLPALKTPSVRIQQTATDPATPNSAKAKILALAPQNLQLVKYMDARDLLQAWQAGGLSGWIKQQLRPQADTTSPIDRRSASSGN